MSCPSCCINNNPPLVRCNPTQNVPCSSSTVAVAINAGNVLQTIVMTANFAVSPNANGFEIFSPNQPGPYNNFLQSMSGPNLGDNGVPTVSPGGNCLIFLPYFPKPPNFGATYAYSIVFSSFQGQDGRATCTIGYKGLLIAGISVTLAGNNLWAINQFSASYRNAAPLFCTGGTNLNSIPTGPMSFLLRSKRFISSKNCSFDSAACVFNSCPGNNLQAPFLKGPSDNDVYGTYSALPTEVIVTYQ